MITIRKLRPADNRLDVGRIYEVSWKYAYKELLPQKYLNNLSSEQWANRLDTPNRYSLIAELDGKMIGIASYGESREVEYAGQGETYSIYFLPQYMRNGYGKQLINAAIEQLHIMGYKSIFLWVHEENLGARGFYESRICLRR